MFLIFHYFNQLTPQRDCIALLISVSLFPAATAFSIKESEMSELDPSFIKSSVNGIPNFWAISLTLSYEALASIDAVAEACERACTGAAGFGIAIGFGAITAAGAAVAAAATYALCLANTEAITD